MENAPGVAINRCKNVASDVSVTTPAGKFKDCVEVSETLNGKKRTKIYCPEVGLVSDGGLKLVKTKRIRAEE